mgnify:CR=1 FL=1
MKLLSLKPTINKVSTYIRNAKIEAKEKEIHRIITEGTMKTAYLKDINNILCPIPDIDSQKLIANKLASITVKIELEQQVLSLLQMQKKYLLSNLFI